MIKHRLSLWLLVAGLSVLLIRPPLVYADEGPVECGSSATIGQN
jgi:hypothetical protein